jgi:hypothetical protein
MVWGWSGGGGYTGLGPGLSSMLMAIGKLFGLVAFVCGCVSVLRCDSGAMDTKGVCPCQSL